MQFTVERYVIIGAPVAKYSVWEPRNNHTTITTIDGKPMGELNSRPLPAKLAAMPIGADRYDAMMNYHAALNQLAFDVVMQAYSHLEDVNASNIKVTDVVNEWFPNSKAAADSKAHYKDTVTIHVPDDCPDLVAVNSFN